VEIGDSWKKKKVEEWNKEDVQQFFYDNKLAKYSSEFLAMDGKKLISLHEEFKSIFIRSKEKNNKKSKANDERVEPPPKKQRTQNKKTPEELAEICFKQLRQHQPEKDTSTSLMKIKNSNILFIVISWRKFSLVVWKDLIENKRVDVILGREELKCLYGPTLQDLGHLC